MTVRPLLAALACASAYALTACGGSTPPPPTTTSTAAPTSVLSPSAAPTPAATVTPEITPIATPGPGQTAPEKLDGALLKPTDLPGWQAGEDSGDPSGTKVDPEACTALHQATIGKIASDMGATKAYQNADQELQEYLDVVDSGAQSVDQIVGLVDRCGTFTMIDADEHTPVRVEKFDVPGVGDRSVGLHITLQGDAPVEMFAVVAGRRDVLLTLTLQADHPNRQTVVDLARPAMAHLDAAL